MNRKSLTALAVLNVVLLLALAVVLLTPAGAVAQARVRPGEYLMISGSVAGRNNQAMVYIFEVRSTKLVAALYSSSDNSFTTIGGRVLNDDVAAAAGAR